MTDPSTGITKYGYDGLDQLTQVTDPRNLVTGYTVDGLGNLAQQSSPDTGTSASTYDTARNLLTRTDAKSQVTSYVYDALNRVTSITFNDSSRQTYAYDQGTNGIGRLTQITETDPASQVTNQIAYAYDQKGPRAHRDAHRRGDRLRQRIQLRQRGAHDRHDLPFGADCGLQLRRPGGA